MVKFAVVWHEDNDSGVPKHVMGMSELFDTLEKAKWWVNRTIAEDRVRAEEYGGPKLEVYPGEENGTWFTIGNGQTTYYHIEEIEVPTSELEGKLQVMTKKYDRRKNDFWNAIGLIKNWIALDDFVAKNGWGATMEDGTTVDDRWDEAKASLSNLVVDADMSAVHRQRTPLKEFEVQVVFSPATVMKVTARNAKEAQNIVNSRIDNRELVLSDEQKTGIVNDILENVESVKVLGSEE